MHHLIICAGSARGTYHLFIWLNQLQMWLCFFFHSFFPSLLAFLTSPGRHPPISSFNEGIWKALGNGLLIPLQSGPQGWASHIILTGLCYSPAQKQGLDKLRPQAAGTEGNRNISCAQESSSGEGIPTAETSQLTAPVGTYWRNRVS